MIRGFRATCRAGAAVAMTAGLVVAAATGASASVLSEGDAPAERVISATETSEVLGGLEGAVGVVGADGAFDVLGATTGAELPTGIEHVAVPEKVAKTGDVVSYDKDGEFNLLNNVCVAPWYWEGPGNVGSVGNVTDYQACNTGDTELGGEGSVNIANNLCVAPWYWDGPLNLFSKANVTEYAACN